MPSRHKCVREEILARGERKRHSFKRRGGEGASARSDVLTTNLIISATARWFAIHPREITGRGRTRPVSTARHAAMYAAYELTLLSYPEIASMFGGRDQSTVQYGHKKIRDLHEGDEEYRQELNAFLAFLQNELERDDAGRRE